MSGQNSQRLIVGPSHVVRLKHALDTGQLPALTLPSHLVGVGGLPIWSPRIVKEIAATMISHDAFFIVGDFRFGNEVLNDPAFRPDSVQHKEHLAIDKDLINEANDKILFDLSLAALESLSEQLNGRLRLLFWDLSIREYQNRATGRYQETGVYRHPVWNLDSVLARFPHTAIDTQAMLEHGQRLYIDSSAHPSLLGWLYISRHLRGDTQVDLPAISQAFERSLTQLLATVLGKEAVVITGDSKFTRLLDLFVKNRQFILPDKWVILPLGKAAEGVYDHCLYFPSLCTFEMDAAAVAEGVEKVKKFRNRLSAKHKKVSILYYDNWAYEAISKRSGYKGKFACKHPRGLTTSLESATCPSGQSYKIADSADFEGMIELNATLVPTLLGVVEILSKSTQGISHEQLKQAYRDFLTGCL